MEEDYIHNPANPRKEEMKTKVIPETSPIGQFPDIRIDYFASTPVGSKGVEPCKIHARAVIWLGDMEYSPTASECRAYASALNYAANALDREGDLS